MEELLVSIKSPHAFALTHALYHFQIKRINDCLQTPKPAWVPIANNDQRTLPLRHDLEPLAHLTTKQLLALLEESVFSLVKRYDYLLNQEQDPKAIETLRKNQDKLTQLKQTIYRGLLARCQMSTALSMPRQFDDVQGYFQPEKKTDQQNTGSLDDDTRLIIYDILADAGFDKATLYQVIIQVIPKRTIKKLRAKTVINQEISDVYQFTQQVCEALSLQRKKPGRILTLWREVTQKGARLKAKLSVDKFALFWKWRYLFYFLLSFCAYYLLMQAITVAAGLFLGEKILAFIASVLFYTVGLLPLWGGLSQHVYVGIHQLVNYWRAPKQAQIVEALYLLEQTQQFIGYRLNQVIIDIAHCDFDALQQMMTQKNAAISALKKQLSDFSIAQKLVLDKNIKYQAAAISNRLQMLEKDLKTAIQAVVQHMTLRVKEELTLLEKALQRETLTPVFPVSQFKKISAFIHEFGNAKQARTFETQTHITHLWQKGVDQFTWVDSSATRPLQQPFGSHLMRHDIMKGWQILLTQWNDGSEKSKSAHALQGLLSGKQVLTSQALSQAVLQVAQNGEDANDLLLKIQSVLFNTLPARDLVVAKLLSAPQKAQIANWYHQHQPIITKARKIMRKAMMEKSDSFFVHYTYSELAQCYQALEGADAYLFSHDKDQVVGASQNKVKHFFLYYRGQTSRAFLLLRFLPEHSKSIMLVKIANKRLDWLLSHLENGVDPAKPFDAQDIEMFLQHDLTQHQRFHFSQAIQNSHEFAQGWNEKMAKFLQSCRKMGLDTGQLLTEYQKKKQPNKPLLLPRFTQQMGKLPPLGQTITQRDVICASHKIAL